jgi:hypothetical protein
LPNAPIMQCWLGAESCGPIGKSCLPSIA